MQLTLTERELKIAREWIKDCMGTWSDILSEDEVDELTDAEIERGIHRQFDGGINAFKATCKE